MDRELIYTKLKSLVHRFEANKYHYLSKNYLEEEVKIDFINPLFEALGWDVRNTKGLSPYEREVVVEKGETEGRPDYNFRIDGQTKFFLEAKAPHEPLHKINHVLQAKSYAWNTKNVFIVLLTDFEEFRLFDATIKPNPKNSDQGLIFELTYDQYLDNLDKLILLSKAEVERDVLNKLILKDSQSKRLRIPVDKAFLEDISRWREDLAKDIYKRNIKELEDRTDEKRIKIQVKILNEAVQKILDRLIFIRISEDRKIIEPKSLLDEVEWWKAGGKRRDLHKRLTDRFMGWNQDFNGEILKPGPCDILDIDSQLLAKIIDGLYFPKCPYLFDVIGVELLGSIYERYLGKTIKVTPKRVKIEEKPEVRKAGGVYYTPQYIVDYIVKNTVGKIIKGKAPKQIEKIKILDPACGSGSFLLTAFQTLIDYHLVYYEKHPEESGKGTLFPDVITNYDGTKRLSIEKKVQILGNNIFGVDIDSQAVEIAMMSLCLKCLEEEKDLPRKKELLPSLAKNIRCGNSLISYDIFDQLTLFDEEKKERINPFDWYSKSTGFGEIMEQGGFDVVIGNPPYVRPHKIELEIKSYLWKHFNSFVKKSDLYSCFLEKGISLLKNKALLGLIVSNSWLRLDSFQNLRQLLLSKSSIQKIIEFTDNVFDRASIKTLIIVLSKGYKPNSQIQVTITSSPSFLTDLKFKKIHQKTFNSTYKMIFDLSINESAERIKQKMVKKSVQLGEICQIAFGIKTGDDSLFVTREKRDDNHKPLLRGANIHRYSFDFSSEYVWYVPEKMRAHRKTARPGKAERFEQPKVLIRDTGNALEGTFDDEDFYVKDVLVISHKEVNVNSLKFLCGLLNSQIMKFYYETSFPTLHVQRSELASLPIYFIDFSNPSEKILHEKIVSKVDQMLELNKKKDVLPPSSKREKIEREIQITDEKIDELVYKLYGITEEERKIIENTSS